MTTTRRALGLGAGVTVALALHLLAGVGASDGLAQSTTNTTQTVSTTSSSSFESPPACSAIGSSRQVVTVTTQITVGPACIGIGNRDIVNPAPACEGLPAAPPPVDPGRGTVRLVPFGSANLNLNTHTETIQCVAAVPALPLPLLFGLGAALAALGAYGRRRLNGRSA